MRAVSFVLQNGVQNCEAPTTGLKAEHIKQWYKDAKMVDDDGEPVNPDAVEI